MTTFPETSPAAGLHTIGAVCERLRDTVTSSRNTSHSGDRPISARSPIASKLSPARPPPDRTTSAGPSMRSCAGAASTSSGPRLMVVSPTVSRARSAPQREQYVAASGL